MNSKSLAVTALAFTATLIVVVLMLGWWQLRPVVLHGVELRPTDPVGDFQLMGSAGSPVRLSDFRGKWTALYFGYTFCPDVCPTTLSDLTVMLHELGNQRDDVQVLMVTVDPERDTPERLAAYLRFFDPSFIGLSGSPDEIDATATKFGVFYERQPGRGEDYLVNHTSTVILMDPQGRMRVVYPYGVSGNDMAADLRALMRWRLF
jgi:protein SCO1/2